MDGMHSAAELEERQVSPLAALQDTGIFGSLTEPLPEGEQAACTMPSSGVNVASGTGACPSALGCQTPRKAEVALVELQMPPLGSLDNHGSEVQKLVASTEARNDNPREQSLHLIPKTEQSTHVSGNNNQPGGLSDQETPQTGQAALSTGELKTCPAAKHV
ncbi:hypothetical protein KIL84_012802 [Mauremys mutica]|uniref:Uncharacterized protein n=1 Tax=Mauremys mutica TaxID=74926 RepID=A0A9D4B8Q1_9SAUR|nr:hypothetical protein KIL84_012802 [Mauremys mutica]